MEVPQLFAGELYRYTDMNEPEAIWSTWRIVFDNEISTTQNVILSQGRSALRATIDRIDKLHGLVEESPLQNVGIHPDIPPTVSNLCYQAGLASTILFEDGDQGHFESDRAYKLRQKRVKYVNEFCSSQGVEPSLLLDREVRNSLTHIDERLADILTEEGGVGWFIDAAVRRRDEFEAPKEVEVRFCRSYVIEEDRILHLGQELDLGELRRECVAVLAVVFGVDYDNQFDEA